jgi:thiol-disulfide isomerase/thioredoxin
VELGIVALVAALAVGALLGVLKSRYDGHFRKVAHPEPEAVDVLTPEQIGAELGKRATLVQFSSAFCAPCRATHRVLAEVAGMVGGVRHVEIDAESRLDLVRRLDILRTPTVLVLDRDGAVVTRASGQPRKPDVIAALGRAVQTVH